jgi:hypothetical protein
LGDGTGQKFDCATWLHKARGTAKEQFRREVQKELTGKENEASELVYFKLYKSGDSAIEQAIEIAAFHARLRQIARLLPGDRMGLVRQCGVAF